MSIPYRTLFVFLILSLAIVPGFSQEANTKKAETKTPLFLANIFHMPVKQHQFFKFLHNRCRNIFTADFIICG